MKIYVARPGDSLAAVAGRLGVDPAELAGINRLSDPRRLTAGLALAVPGTYVPTRRMELGAWPGKTMPGGELAKLLPALSYACLGCRRIDPSGRLCPDEGGPGPELAEREGAVPLMAAANLDERGYWSARAAHIALATEEGRRALLGDIIYAVEEGGWGGVHLSLCGLFPFDREGLSRFLSMASAELHRRGRYLTVSAAVKEREDSPASAAYDYACLGRYADRVALLAYDWGCDGSAPQAVSPVDRIRRALDRAAEELPPGKTLLAVSGRAYSWGLPWRIGDRARALTHAAAANLAVSVGARVRMDEASKGSWFCYADAAGARRVVWYEDVRSVEARLELAESYGLAGLCLMPGGRLDTAALELIKSRYEPEKLM